jgi:hypothetical protein
MRWLAAAACPLMQWAQHHESRTRPHANPAQNDHLKVAGKTLMTHSAGFITEIYARTSTEAMPNAKP